MAKQSGKKTKKGKTPKELMHKHLLDKEDVISEEDFKNMEIGPDIDKTGEQQELELPDNKDRPKDEDKDPSIITSWDVIS